MNHYSSPIYKRGVLDAMEMVARMAEEERDIVRSLRVELALTAFSMRVRAERDIYAAIPQYNPQLAVQFTDDGSVDFASMTKGLYGAH